MFEIVKRRYWYFLLSLVVIIPGLIFMGLNWANNPAQGPLPLSIDYTGGTLIEVKYTNPTTPLEPERIRAIYDANDSSDSIVQTSGTDTAIIRSKALTPEQQGAILAQLAALYGTQYELVNAATVGPSVGREVTVNAAYAVGAAALGILLYIWYAFRNLENAWRYGLCAIIAMLHDILVVLGAAAIFGRVFGWEVDALFLTALLTVASFSVHDTIVVFDRIRENLILHRRVEYETVVNHSIVQTLDRSINTQLTVTFTLLALALFGGVTIRHFVVTLLVGVLSGTYSSIFNAAPLLVVLENKEWRTWGRGSSSAPAEA